MEFIEDFLVDKIKEYGYIILFLWCILEGELALIMGGILSHSKDMYLPLGIFIAGLGGFTGDQIYFYIGRFNKKYINKKLSKQRRKFAIAHILLQKYGWPIIFIQRYMYGLRTILPMAIGTTRYSAKKFALINLISAWCWASLTMIPAWYFGEEIFILIGWAKNHWYFAIPLIMLFVLTLVIIFKKIENNIYNNNKRKKNALQSKQSST